MMVQYLKCYQQYFLNELLLEFTMLFYKRSHWLFATGGIQFTALIIHSYGIHKRQLSLVQLWLKFNDVIQVSRYAFSNSK